MNNLTDKMFKILKESYTKECGKEVVIADLGHSTNELNFFVTSTVSSSISSSQIKSSYSLINKLISLSSQQKYSIIDSVVSKVNDKFSKIKSDLSKSYEVISSKQKASDFQVIEELNEDEIIEEIKAADPDQEEPANPMDENKVQKVSLKIKELNKINDNSSTY